MATLKSGTVEVTLNSAELVLILRALETYVQHCPMSEDDAVHRLHSDLTRGAADDS